MKHLEPIKNILVCPACRGGLLFEQDDITCLNCKQVYPIYENIPQFALYQNDETASREPAEISKNHYEQRYEDFEKARNYNLKYDRKLLKRLSTMREYQILRRLLGRQKPCATMLEIPCGGGRISPQLVNATDLLIQADVGLGQILYGMTREKFKIPHQREDLLAELLRVARRYVVMTFFDYHSIKNTLRRIRNSKPKFTMAVSQVASVAAAHGATLAACPRLSIIGSGHRYALMVKAPSD
ncbi:MAG: hypothetical protein P8X85_10225 [Desulfobacterales bacterium]